MFLWEIEYNAIMLAADLGLLFFFGRKKNFFALVTGMAIWGILSVSIAFLLAPGNFGTARLACYAIFIHGIILGILFFLLLFRNSKLLSFFCLAISILLVFIGVDAFFIEPHQLEISRVNFRSAKLKEPLKIVVFSDFQTDALTDYEKNVIEKTLEERPHIILMPGDYIQVNNREARETLYSEMNKILKEKKFSALQGVFAVRGNAEAGDWPRIFDGIEVVCFEKSGTDERKNFVITGLDLDDSFDRGIKIERHEKFHIIFGHSPDFSLSNPDADLLIAGHTHGGQVRLPVIGPLFTLSEVPKEWASGVTDIDNNTKLIVSRGIGMERDNAPRLRFLCRPEIVVVTVEPE